MQGQPVAVAPCALDLKPAAELRILPAGSFRARDGRPKDASIWRLDRGLAEALILRVASRNTRLVIDYEHQTLYAERNGQPAPAAGWFKTLAWRDPTTHGEAAGLYALDIQWTDRAKAMIEAGEYKYLSPVFSYDANGAVLDLLMAAVTNNPALNIPDELTARAAAHFYTRGESRMAMTSVEQAARSAFETNPAIRAEFDSLGTYMAYCKAEAAGKVKIFGAAATPREPRRAALASVMVEQRAKAEFETNPAIRAEFDSLEVYMAFCRANEAGLVSVCHCRSV